MSIAFVDSGDFIDFLSVMRCFKFLSFCSNDVFGFPWMIIDLSYLYSRPPTHPPTHPLSHPPTTHHHLTHLLHFEFRRVIALTTGSLVNLRLPGEMAISAEVVQPPQIWPFPQKTKVHAVISVWYQCVRNGRIKFIFVKIKPNQAKSMSNQIQVPPTHLLQVFSLVCRS